MVTGQLYMKEGSDIYPVKRCDEDTLYLSLLVESNDKSYVLRDGKLQKVSLLQGLGREKLTLQAPLKEEVDEQEEAVNGQGEESGDSLNLEDTDPDVRLRSVDAVVVRILKTALLKHIKYPADAYFKSLKDFRKLYTSLALAKRIKDQLEIKKLAEEDIDLLLCISHLLMRGSNLNGSPFGQPKYYQSVFIDEVQDFTEQQVYLMVEQARPEYRAVTVVGDIAQKLHHGSRIDIPACFPAVRNLPCIKLSENIRQLAVPGLALFSACFRGLLHEGQSTIEPTPELVKHLKAVKIIQGPELVSCKNTKFLDEEIIKVLRGIPQGPTVAVILPTTELAHKIHERLRPTLASFHLDTEVSEKVDLARRHLKHFTSVQNAKGLEFDYVILPMLEEYDMTSSENLNSLYVGLTRARTRLVMMHSKVLHTRLKEVVALFDQLKTKYDSDRLQKTN